MSERVLSYTIKAVDASSPAFAAVRRHFNQTAAANEALAKTTTSSNRTMQSAATMTQRVVSAAAQQQSMAMKLVESSLKATAGSFPAVTRAAQGLQAGTGRAVSAVTGHFKRLAADAGAALRGVKERLDEADGSMGGFKVQAGSASSVVAALLLPMQGLGKIAGVAVTVLGNLGSVLGSMVTAAFSAASAVGGALYLALEKTASLAATGATVGFAAVTASLAAFARQGINVNLLLGRSASTFSLLFKSMDAGKRTMKALTKEASTSAYELTTLSQAGELLASFGFKENEILPWLRAIGDAAGGSQDKLMGMVTAVGQIKAKGKLQAEELMQLQERGIPTRELLQLPEGVDPGKSGLTADQGLQRLLVGLQSRYGGRQAAAMQTLPGIGSNIQDAVNASSAGATEGLLARLTTAAQTVLDFLNKVGSGGAGSKALQMITGLFNRVGDGAVYVAKQIPGAVTALEAMLSGVPWGKIEGTAKQVFDVVWKGAQAAGNWLSANWKTIWSNVQLVTTEAGANLAGVIGGVQAVIRHFARGGGDDIRAFMLDLREFAADASMGLGRLTAVVSGLGAALAASAAFSPEAIATGQTANFLKISKSLAETAVNAPKIGDATAATIRGMKTPDQLLRDVAGDGTGKVFAEGFIESRNSARKAITGMFTGGGGGGFAAPPDQAAALAKIGITPEAYARRAQAAQAAGMIPGAPQMFGGDPRHGATVNGVPVGGPPAYLPPTLPAQVLPPLPTERGITTQTRQSEGSKTVILNFYGMSWGDVKQTVGAELDRLMRQEVSGPAYP